MTRRRSYRTRRSTRDMRLRGAERVIFIVGAACYVIGLFGGLGLFSMPAATAILLLGIGGGLLFFSALMLIF